MLSVKRKNQFAVEPLQEKPPSGKLASTSTTQEGNWNTGANGKKAKGLIWKRFLKFSEIRNLDMGSDNS
jgi:hypothetical protein